VQTVRVKIAADVVQIQGVNSDDLSAIDRRDKSMFTCKLAERFCGVQQAGTTGNVGENNDSGSLCNGLLEQDYNVFRTIRRARYAYGANPDTKASFSPFPAAYHSGVLVRSGKDLVFRIQFLMPSITTVIDSAAFRVKAISSSSAPMKVAS
jgi:hypothetical protein